LRDHLLTSLKVLPRDKSNKQQRCWIFVGSINYNLFQF